MGTTYSSKFPAPVRELEILAFACYVGGDCSKSKAQEEWRLRKKLPLLFGSKWRMGHALHCPTSSGLHHLYSVAALTDADGNVVERYRYDAYGDMTVEDVDGDGK